MKPTDPDYPTTIQCPYCDGRGYNRDAQCECGFCTRGRLTITEPFLGAKR
jgi:hypothetical protein